MTQRLLPAFWDNEFEVPAPFVKNAAMLAAWLRTKSPPPEVHDFVLWTDGSGDTQGFGASAAVWLCQASGDYGTSMKAVYNQTVQRNEMSAFLDGLQGILAARLQAILRHGEKDGSDPLVELSGDGRITVLWYTDRQNLAMSLLFDTNGNPLNSRKKERDLWLRFSGISRYFCITPVHISRNSVKEQELCDSLCHVLRVALLETSGSLGKILNNANCLPSTWTKQLPQAANF